VLAFFDTPLHEYVGGRSEAVPLVEPSDRPACCVRETHGPPKLPKGYRLDLSADPDAPALRRPDGTVVARFSVRSMTSQAIEREALEDLLHTSRKPEGGTPSPWQRSVGRDLPNTPS
jgi:hypothetical protein